MALPVIPNHPTVQLKMSDIADSCNLNQTTNISLRGLSINNPSLTYYQAHLIAQLMEVWLIG